MKTKKCSNKNCDKSVKPISEFHKNKNFKDELQPYCKKCCKDYHKKFPWKRILRNIQARCNNPKNDSYKNYGGKGIECLITEDELKRLWYRDKTYLMDRPSIDRKKNDKNYTFDNCQFIELWKNIGKDKRKFISQFDLDGNFIKEWKSQSEAGRELNINRSHICNVASGKRKTAGGFKWRT